MLEAPRGIVPAVVTPFQDNERIDYRAWQNLIEMLIASRVDGILALGGHGEFFSLGDEECEVAARFVVQAVNRRVPVYVHIGAVSTMETISLAQRAEADGADCLVAITPFYNRPNAGELVDHYTDVCRSVRIPVMGYNVPQRTGADLTPAVAAQVKAQCANFAGVVDFSGSLDAAVQYAAAGVPLMMGCDHLIVDALKRGASGAVSGGANVAPRLFIEMVRAFESGDVETAARLQSVADPLRRAFSLATFPSAIKEAMALAGMPVGGCRRPVGAVPDEVRARLEEILAPLRAEGYLPVLPVRV